MLSYRQITNLFDISADSSHSILKAIADIVLPTGSSLKNRLRLLKAIYDFSPILKFHPDDEYLPSSVAWYLNRVKMRFHRSGKSDLAVLSKGQVNSTSILNQRAEGQFSSSTNKSDFFLQIPNDELEKETRRGDLSNANCYVHVRSGFQSSNDFDIQYWFFYPYSGNIAKVGNFAHEGDWEHITVVVEDYREIKHIWFSEHGNSHKYLERTENRTTGYELNSAGHPMVYSAKHSHASYPEANTIDQVISVDELSNVGPSWNTWNKLVLIGTKSSPSRGQEWIQYNGRWGELGITDTFGTSGPYGPAFQESWLSET